MKKRNFITLVMGVISGLLFAIGMCMALLPEWDMFKEGIIMGSIGLVLGIITVFVWRKLANKEPIKVSGKLILTILLGAAGALLLGVGMCLCMVWSRMILGICIGVVGIAVLL